MKVFLKVLLVLALVALVATAVSAKQPLNGNFQRVPFTKISDEQIYDSERYEGLQRNSRKIHDLLGGHHVSKRGLHDRGISLSKSGADTLKVLIVRIGFESDRSGDLTSVTTDGDFRLEPDGARIDPAPHDKDFYGSHLYGLSEYYKVQSGGRLVIRGRVLPEGDNDCYKLSDIADYGPGQDGGWTIELLENLVIDMIEKADEGILNDTELGFTLADFDDDNELTYVIFVHAGSDWQSDINGDSPNDIPTFFVTLGDPVALQSFDSETGVPGALTECSIIPETTTQDGYIGSIAGALYHEFGHSLGLPDVYDTSTGLPAAGIWDLMDSGPNLIANLNFGTVDEPDVESVSGLLPPSLSAWCKWYLGWLVTHEAGHSQSWNIPAVQVPRDQYSTLYGDPPFNFSLLDPQALIGGASPQEFFLMENRWVPFSSDEFPDEQGIGFLQDQDTGVFLYLAGDDNRNTGMYDYFLPQGGLLVWHVNESVIEANLATNTINAGQQGLRLVEADGIRDIGVYEPYVIGFYGSATDPFHSGINSTLRSEGVNSTLAIDRSWTGFEMTDISEASSVMSFNTSCNPVLPNSPITVEASIDGARYFDPQTVTPFDIGPGRTSSELALIFSDKSDSGECTLFALDKDGAPAVQSSDSSLPAGAFWELPSPLAGPPVVIDIGYEKRVVFSARDGSVVCFGQEVLEDGWVPIWETSAISDTISAMPIVGYDAENSPYMLFCGNSGVLHQIPGDANDASEISISTLNLSDVVGFEISDWISDPLVVRMSDNNYDSFVVFTSEFWFLIGFDGDSLSVNNYSDYGGFGFEEIFPSIIESNNEQLLVIISETGYSTSTVLNVDRTAPTMPQSWSGNVSGQVVADPAVADLDGDGVNDIILISGNSVNAFNCNGVALTGFPVSIPQLFPLSYDLQLSGSVVVFDSTGDGVNELYVTSTVGHLIGLDCTGNLMDYSPLLCADSGFSSLTVTGNNDYTGGYLLWIATEGSGKVPGLSTVERGGRLIGVTTVAEQISQNETSKWLGYRGGAFRSGPVGEAVNLELTAPSQSDLKMFICYPNPVGPNENVNFRFYAPNDGIAEISVYNLEGELVVTRSSPINGESINEIEWEPLGVASGVYICRLRLPADDGNQIRQTVLAIEK
jgi:M6 family metalloprotease-like protein